MYLRDRETELSRESLESHRYRLSQFTRWCEAEEQDISNMNEITGRTTTEYRLFQQSRVADTTLKGYIDSLRVFLRFCESIDAVRDDVAESTISPTVTSGSSERIVEADQVESILSYLSRFEWASRDHVVIKILWVTGMRMGALQSIDLDDVRDDRIELRHRPDEGTTLKNKNEGERYVSIPGDLAEIIDAYVSQNRCGVTDRHGRDPLVTTEFGRPRKSTLRQWCYRLTRPCTYAQCPHDRNPADCEGMKSRTPFKCPSSEAPHAIRRGAITHYLSEDVPKPVVSERFDVSEPVLDKHYDERSKSKQMEQRRKHMPW